MKPFHLKITCRRPRRKPRATDHSVNPVVRPARHVRLYVVQEHYIGEHAFDRVTVFYDPVQAAERFMRKVTELRGLNLPEHAFTAPELDAGGGMDGQATFTGLDGMDIRIRVSDLKEGVPL